MDLQGNVPAEKFQSIMIAYYFGSVCGCPEESDWKKGTVDYVIRDTRGNFEITIGTDFEYILRDVMWHKNQGTTYTGERQLRNGVVFGQKALTNIESIEAHIVGYALEYGCSIRMAWAFLADHSREEGK